MLGMFGIKIMSGNQLLNGYANGITPNGFRLGDGGEFDALQLKLLPKLIRNTEAEI